MTLSWDCIVAALPRHTVEVTAAVSSSGGACKTLTKHRYMLICCCCHEPIWHAVAALGHTCNNQHPLTLVSKSLYELVGTVQSLDSDVLSPVVTALRTHIAFGSCLQPTSSIL